MGDIILFVFVIVALTTIWVEWVPRKYDIVIGVSFSIMIIGIGIRWLPNWYGWLVVVIGIADFAWQYNKGVRAFDWPTPVDVSKGVDRGIRAGIGSASNFFRKENSSAARAAVVEEPAPPERSKWRMSPRVWIGGIALTVLSPITAVPAAIVLAIVLTITNSVLIDSGSLVSGVAASAKAVLGNAYLIQVATLDLMIRGFLLTVPLLLAAGFAGARWADRSVSYWRRLVGASVLIGALYPSIFIVASAMGRFNEPFFN